jgi:outer membrane lipoprotein-sorting protein
MSRIRRMIVCLALGLTVVGFWPRRGAAQGQQGASPAAPPAASGELGSVIAELNAASARFKSAQADFRSDQFEAVVQEDEIQTGTIYFERRKGETEVSLQIKQEDGQDAPKFVVYDNGEVQFYQPAIKQMTIFRAGANRSQADSFLTLGFGGSGTDLEQNWEVALAGKETLDGTAVARLDLKPKAQNVQSTFSHVSIWVDPARGVSLKQIFYEPSGDRRTTTYTNIKYNQPIPEDVFHIKTAPGTTIQTK